MDEFSNQKDKVQTGKSSDPFKLLTMLMALLAMAVGVYAIWQTFQVSSLSSKVSSLEASAAELQASKNSLQSELDKLNGGDTTSSSGETSTSDTTKILAAADAYVRAPVAAKGAFEYAIKVNDGNFATVNVSVSEGGGYMLWLKKVSDNWTVLFGGQDSPTQELIDKYGLSDAVSK